MTFQWVGFAAWGRRHANQLEGIKNLRYIIDYDMKITINTEDKESVKVEVQTLKSKISQSFLIDDVPELIRDIAKGNL